MFSTTTIPVAPAGSAAAGDDNRGASSVPPAPRGLLEQPLVRLLLVVAVGAAALWFGLDAYNGGGAGGAKDAAQGKGGKGKDAAAPKPARSPSKSPKPKPSPSPTSSPAGACTCEVPKDEPTHRVILHFLSVDSPEGVCMGNVNIGGGAVSPITSAFLLYNVMDIVNKDPVYTMGRTVVLYRPRGPFEAPVGATSGHEVNQNTYNTLAGAGVFSSKVMGQTCEVGNGPPVFLYADTAADADAGEWLGESAANLFGRWTALKKAEPTATLLLKAPATHKSAMLQLLGIPSTSVAYVNKGGIPCDTGNKMYIPPMGQNALGGWSQSWWKEPNFKSVTVGSRLAAGLLACPATPPAIDGGKGVVLVPRTDAERLEAKGKASDFESEMTDHVESIGGKVVKMPESLSLTEDGTEMKDFVKAIGSARVVILPATSATGFYAGLARGATILVADGKSSEGAKVLNVPGRKTEMGQAKKDNIVILLPENKAKGEGVAAAKAAIQEVIDGKEKTKMPKCVKSE